MVHGVGGLKEKKMGGGISTKTAAFLGEIREAYAVAGFFNRLGLDWSSVQPRPTLPWSSAKDDWMWSRGE